MLKANTVREHVCLVFAVTLGWPLGSRAIAVNEVAVGLALEDLPHNWTAFRCVPTSYLLLYLTCILAIWISLRGVTADSKVDFRR